MIYSLIHGAALKAVFFLSLLAFGCIEAPPNNLGQPDTGTPDMAVPDMAVPDMARTDAGVEDMSNPNNVVVDMSVPDTEPDVPVPDMTEDLPVSVSPEPFDVTLVAPGTNFPQNGIPLWVRFQADELEHYRLNQAHVQADFATELALLVPGAAKTIGFWAKWPLLGPEATSRTVRIEPSQAVTNTALWSDFAHVWHMSSTPTSIPSSKGGIALNPERVMPGVAFLGPAFRGYAHAENITVGQEFTIMFWFRYSSQDSLPVRLLSLNEDAGTTPEFRLELVGNYLKMIQGGLDHSHATEPLAANQFHHVVLARTSTGVEIRVNGVRWGSNGAPANGQRQSTFSVKLGQSGKNLAFAELWMAEGSIPEERLRLLYRNQSQGVQSSPNSLIVTESRP